MAFPTVLFHLVNGSDTAASGAGPTTAQSGYTARTRGTSPITVGLFDVSIDLSGVNTDGSHVLYAATASGRRFFKITGKKDTVQDVTGGMSSGSAVLSSTNTTGMSVNDHIRVTGAGASGADLYTEISSIDSGSQATLKDTASTTVIGAAVKCTKNVTVSNIVTMTSNLAWAIGGKRKDIAGSRQLFSDVLPGWSVEFQYHDNQPQTTYVVDTVLNLSVAGDTTDGRITIKGSGVFKPIIKANTTAVNAFEVQAAYYTFKNLQFDRANDGIRYGTANATDLLIEDCDFIETASAGFAANPVRVSSTATAGRLHVRNCKFHMIDGVAVAAIDIGASIGAIIIEDCLFTTPARQTSVGRAVNNTVAPGVLILRRNRVTRCDSGFILGSSATAGLTIIENNVFFDITQIMVQASHVARCRNMICRNNIFMTTPSTALDLPSGSVHAVSNVDQNYFCDCVIPRSGGTPVGPSDMVGALNSEVNPQFWDSVNDDFRIGTNLRGLTATNRGGGDPGAFQRVEPLSAFDIFARIVSATDDNTHWTINYIVHGGNQNGLIGTMQIEKAAIPPVGDPFNELLLNAALGFLRTNSGTLMANKEATL